jgi:hypothetical protein
LASVRRSSPTRYRMDRNAPMSSRTSEVTTPTTPTINGETPPQSEPPAASLQPWANHAGDVTRMAIVTTRTAPAAIAHHFTSRSYAWPLERPVIAVPKCVTPSLEFLPKGHRRARSRMTEREPRSSEHHPVGLAPRPRCVFPRCPMKPLDLGMLEGDRVTMSVELLRHRTDGIEIELGFHPQVRCTWDPSDPLRRDHQVRPPRTPVRDAAGGRDVLTSPGCQNLLVGIQMPPHEELARLQKVPQPRHGVNVALYQ